MVNLKLKEKIYNLPTSWGEVTLGQFQKISKIEFTTQISYIIKVLIISTGLDEATILAIKKEQLTTLFKNLEFIYKQEFKETLTNVIVVNGVEYIFKDLSSLTIGETISIEMLIKKYGGNLVLGAHEILAILYEEKDKEFDASILNDKAKLFKDKLMIDEVYKAIFFFITFEKEFLKSMRDFSEKKKNQKQTQTVPQLFKRKKH